MTLQVPSTPATVGPVHRHEHQHHRESKRRTRTPPTSTVTASASSSLHCSSYPNDILPSGFTNTLPPGLPDLAGDRHGRAGEPASAAPHARPGPTSCTARTPRWVTSCSTTSSPPPRSRPSSLSAGEQFDVTGYQTHIPLPAGLVSAAAGLGNSSFNGLAASAVDAYGATPDAGLDGVDELRRAHPEHRCRARASASTSPPLPPRSGPSPPRAGPSPSPRTSPRWWWPPCRARRSRCRARPIPTTAWPSRDRRAPPRPGPPIRPVIATAIGVGVDAHDDHDADRPRRPTDVTHRPLRAVLPGQPGGRPRAQRHDHDGHDHPFHLDPGPAVPAGRTSRPSSRSPRAWSNRPRASGSPRSRGTCRCSSTPRACRSFRDRSVSSGVVARHVGDDRCPPCPRPRRSPWSPSPPSAVPPAVSRAVPDRSSTCPST